MFQKRYRGWKPAAKVRFRTKIMALLAIGLLLCGFTWNWTVEFAASVLFPMDEAVDLEMVSDFPSLVDPDDLRLYLTEPVMAQQITDGLRSNLSADGYGGIELPDMTKEPLGKKIIRIILDRIFS